MDSICSNQMHSKENTYDTKDCPKKINIIKKDIPDIDELIFPDDEPFYISER